jgi:2-polyprenyl-3-methyl-5-hydroxy-6-metoxy-1,4-benzoquinol methylase
VLQAQGNSREASARFARALELMPQLFEQFGPICATLVAVLPPLGDAMRRATKAWPNRLPLAQLLADARLAAVAADPLLLTILQSTPVCDVALERVLTMLRAALLGKAADAPVNDTTLAFICALAQQCFINEYVFDVTSTEQEHVEQLKSTLSNTVCARRTKILPQQLAAIAMYEPLHALPDAEILLDFKWPSIVDAVVTQQLREPMQERALRDSILQLTAINDDVSQRVRQQYEENPYPRWVHVAGNVEPVTIDHYLRIMIPGATFASISDKSALDILVAGCGTGSHPIEIARKLLNARVLAIDLSLSSLAYAKRKTPPELRTWIDYAQADILKLGAIDRVFDIVDASGVLHHMSDPVKAIHILLALLRPGGLMHLGLYSEVARRDVTAARNYVAEKGYRPTVDGIRRCRQDLLNSQLRSVARASDFFSTSECRDLLFHVQEHQLTIAKIKSLLAEAGLSFIGFVFDPPRARHYALLFAQAEKSTTDLDAWAEFETRNPGTFEGMYQFWAQKLLS